MHENPNTNPDTDEDWLDEKEEVEDEFRETVRPEYERAFKLQMTSSSSSSSTTKPTATKPTPNTTTRSVVPSAVAKKPSNAQFNVFAPRPDSNEDDDDDDDWGSDENNDTPTPKASMSSFQPAASKAITQPPKPKPQPQQTKPKTTTSAFAPPKVSRLTNHDDDDDDDDDDWSSDGGDDAQQTPSPARPPTSSVSRSTSSSAPTPKPVLSTQSRSSVFTSSGKGSEVEQAKRASAGHKRWIIDLLKEHGGACPSGEIYEVAEDKECDTCGAMLKILKKAKVIDFEGVFLMHPMHKDTIVKLTNPDFDPFA